MVTRLLTRLEDDRLLPAFVLVSMVAGILIGLFGVRASDGMAVAGAAA